jgi:hypothetical protein
VHGFNFCGAALQAKGGCIEIWHHAWAGDFSHRSFNMGKSLEGWASRSGGLFRLLLKKKISHARAALSGIVDRLTDQRLLLRRAFGFQGVCLLLFLARPVLPDRRERGALTKETLARELARDDAADVATGARGA